jgi:hypothetical protein
MVIDDSLKEHNGTWSVGTLSNNNLREKTSAGWAIVTVASPFCEPCPVRANTPSHRPEELNAESTVPGGR